jgi:hypothetical protein
MRSTICKKRPRRQRPLRLQPLEQVLEDQSSITLFVYGAYEFQNNGLASSSPSFSSPTADGIATLMGLRMAVR